MTTKPSDAPWADEPYRLIPISSKKLGITSHPYVYCASEIAYSHNCLLRGLNAILLQAPTYPPQARPDTSPRMCVTCSSTSPRGSRRSSGTTTPRETCMFPGIEAFTGQPGIMDGLKGQHEEFTPGLDRLLRYAQETPPEEYRWEGPGGMKEIIDGFAPSLTKHLYEEIDVFLGIGNLDSAGLRRCWDEAEEVAKAKGKLYMLCDVFLCVLGTCDKTYEGGNEFPPLPAVLPYVIKYWFGAGNKGAWRFNPCDFWGQPVPLHFLPKNREKK